MGDPVDESGYLESGDHAELYTTLLTIWLLFLKSMAI